MSDTDKTPLTFKTPLTMELYDTIPNKVRGYMIREKAGDEDIYTEYSYESGEWRPYYITHVQKKQRREYKKRAKDYGFDKKRKIIVYIEEER